MEEKSLSKNAPLDRLSAAKGDHLNPRSFSVIRSHSRTITCDQNSSLHHLRKSSNQLINFKIEIVNNRVKKRKVDDSSPDKCYETPAKRSFSPETLSPDLGCFVDYCSSPTREDSVSPFAISKLALLDKTGGKKGTRPHSLKRKEMLLNPVPPFDCAVEGMFCLNPVGTCTSHNVDNCKGPSSNTLQNETLAHRQQLEKGNAVVDEGQEQLKKEINLNDEEEDQGYFSMSYVKDPKVENSPPPLPTTTYNSLLTSGETPQNEHYFGSSSEQAGQHSSLTVKDVDPSLSVPVLESVEFFEDYVEEWSTGLPISQLSSHSITVNSDNDNGAGDTTLDSSFETTLPLQVQVKSLVVVPSQAATSNGTAAHETAVFQGHQYARQARSQRPTVFGREEEWEQKKQLYVHSVSRHMNENRERSQGVMNELLNLMNDVASDGRQWQHPIDLTCRNYQRRFEKHPPQMTLHEWQAKNRTAHKRFAHVPKSFERSQFP
uniref:S100P-binding protein n=1 Tax=Monopterus albus TaxID=43700 RepID=A0A3Q3J879_MONAL|nr:S100P-binding protein [Monopterus albus]